MAKIAIIGIGDVGSTLAYTIELAGLAREIVLIDINKDMAEGHALDMNHGLFFTPPVNIYAGDYSDCKDSQVIVFAAGARQKTGETRLQLVQRNAEISKSIVDNIRPYIGSAVLLITTNPMDVMTHAVLNYSGLPKNQVFGSGTVLDSARFRYTLSRRFDVDARNVHAYVIGEHGDSEVLLWDSANISGVPLTSFCEHCGHLIRPEAKKEIEDMVKRSAYHIIEAKGFTNYGVSIAVLRILGAIIRNENSMLTVSTFLDGEYGLHNVCLSIPCLVNSKGIARIIETPLSQHEEQALENSANVIKSVVESIKIV